MKLSAHGRALIQGFEGLSLKAYPDASGYSIGYGHFGAKPGDVITRAEADRLFDQDVVKYEAAVSLVTPDALQHEFDAMTSLAYNIGTGNVAARDKGFAGSTVARLHNMGDRQGAADAFRMWNKSQGAVHQGLVKRREKERSVYLNGFTPPGSFPTAPPTQSTPGWPEVASNSAPPSSIPPAVSPGAIQTGASVSIVSLAAVAFGWLLYRLIQR